VVSAQLRELASQVFVVNDGSDVLAIQEGERSTPVSVEDLSGWEIVDLEPPTGSTPQWRGVP
jgi:hypothetical protein